MNSALAAYLESLYATGIAHDSAQPDRLLRHRNLEPESAQLLGMVIRMTRAREVVEIGTANAYSTIWLADAVHDVDGHVTSVDTVAYAEARHNLATADSASPGLLERVTLVQQDGGAFLSGLDDASVDLLFLDAERVEYTHWWPHPLRVVRAGGVLVIDNVRSHPDEVAPFLALLAAESTTVVGMSVAVGKGVHLAWRKHPGA